MITIKMLEDNAVNVLNSNFCAFSFQTNKVSKIGDFLFGFRHLSVKSKTQTHLKPVSKYQTV